MGADDGRDYPGTTRKADPVASKDQGDQGDQPDATHDLLLSDGTSVPSSGSIPTHVAVGDRVVPVLAATERQ